MNHSSTERVVACVARRGDRLLICRRPVDKRHGGLWEFPGGKVNPGEDDFMAARRELDEELDVCVVDAGVAEFELHDPGSRFLIAFVPVTFTGVPRSIEHSEVRWATVSEMKMLPMAPSDGAYAEWLRNGGADDE